MTQAAGRGSRHRVAVDVGGTFVDFVTLDMDTGDVRIEKESSIPDRLAEQIASGVARLGIGLDEVAQLFHGTTSGVNALVQERGAVVGLITTRGFRDVLEIGRGRRREIYNWAYRAPPPLIERSMRCEVSQRTTFDGSVLTALDLDDVDRESDLLVRRGAGAIAIAFLHAYANPSHEAAARDRIRARHPGIAVSASHAVTGEWREYERTSTTVLNAFIQPMVQAYLEALGARMREGGYTRPIAIMQSNGGVCSSEAAGERPIRTLMSGPAGGVIGSRFLCRRLGVRNAICTDVGGTTYDVALIEDGAILERAGMEINGRPVLGTLIDITSIGAGGGSVAWLDHRQALQVGPRSAGAVPGPACFGRGGSEPTVTDAHVVLGRIDPGWFLGGRMEIDAEAARRAVATRVAEPLGLDLTEAAEGVLAIAETNMANAIRGKTVARGLDPREFVMVAYGGGGGLFACAVAAELEIPKIVIPAAPANFSAWGLLTADYVEDEVRTKVTPFDAAHLPEHLRTLAGLEGRAREAIGGYGFAPGDVATTVRLDLRFRGQEYTITVPVDWPSGDADALLASARARFVAMHRQLYGHGDAGADLEVVSLRVRASAGVAPPRIRAIPEPPRAGARFRDVHFAQTGLVRCPVLDRASLSREIVRGPAVIDEWTTTTVLHPGWTVFADELGNLVLEPAR